MFLYINNGTYDKEIFLRISFIIASKIRKYLGMNLKKIKDLYTENYEFDEKFEDKWRINIIKTFILPKAIYGINATPTMIPIAF